jgi:hypothetical protein
MLIGRSSWRRHVRLQSNHALACPACEPKGESGAAGGDPRVAATQRSWGIRSGFRQRGAK